MECRTKRKRVIQFKKFSCDICGRAYVSQESLDTHRLSMTKCQRRTLIYTCSFCSRAYGSKKGFEYHLESAHEKIPVNKDDLEKYYKMSSAVPVTPKLSKIKSERSPGEGHDDRRSSQKASDWDSFESDDGFTSAATSKRKITKVVPTGTFPLTTKQTQARHDRDLDYDHRTSTVSGTSNSTSHLTPFRRQFFHHHQHETSTGTVTSVLSNICDFREDSDENSSNDSVEPIGDLILCHICQERFYDPAFLKNHVVNEHDGVGVGVRTGVVSSTTQRTSDVKLKRHSRESNRSTSHRRSGSRPRHQDGYYTEMRDFRDGDDY